MSKYIKVHINNEVIYLNPEFIVGLEPYKDVGKHLFTMPRAEVN